LLTTVHGSQQHLHVFAYNCSPYVRPDRLTVWQAAAAPDYLMIIFVGALVVLPIIVA
jgi:cytochrome d ubiquinol oxidase subunit II